jgi:nucleotide-binding universal stress UspA family protein
MSSNETVLIGVDGSSGSAAALRYGVHEARQLEAGVHLVHVLHENVPVSPMFPLVPQDLEQAGRAILAQAVEDANQVDPSVKVSTTLAHGPRVRAILEAAKHARVVVLGHEPHARFERLVTGSTVTAFAATSPLPVVVVHPDWTPTQETKCVLVGIKSPERSDQLLLRGFAQAAQRKARLLVIHSWELPNEYDDLIGSRIDESEFLAPATHAVQQRVEKLQEAYPTVAVEVRVVHGQAAWILREASNEADLMLLERRRHVFPMGHLGGTMRALLRHSRCPITVLPPADRDAHPDLALERDGALQR